MRRRGLRVGTGLGRVLALPGYGILGMLLLSLLSACASGAAPGTTSATAPALGSPGALTTASVDTSSGPTPTPTILQVSGPGAQSGSAEYCNRTGTVTQPLPAAIPAPPSAVLRLYQSADANKLWGFCTSASVATSGDFYKTQLTANGWQKLTDSSFGDIRQLLGFQGSGAVVVTVQPDAQLSGTTDIIISTSGI